jgi:hypothetical protein
MYGLYESQPPSQLSAFTRIEGSYRVEGDRVVFEPTRLVWWDRFYGATSAESVEPYPWGGIFDDARVSVRGNRLVMQYTTYPADRALPTVAEFTRDHWLPSWAEPSSR